ncbi:hypothetical protein [Roseateles sp.]|uniref:hypothetical protein n=1 Tax=Roseateles sp. TaxID=1971397 RepID=UPI0039488604
MNRTKPLLDTPDIDWPGAMDSQQKPGKPAIVCGAYAARNRYFEVAMRNGPEGPLQSAGSGSRRI